MELMRRIDECSQMLARTVEQVGREQGALHQAV